MSSKRRKSAKRPAYARGSRPVDSRYTRGGYGYQYQRRGLSPFLLSLLVVSGIGVVILLVFILTQNTNNPNGNSAVAQGGTVTPNMTATMVAFSTITSPSVLPRISLADAKALYDAGNVKIVDVRVKEAYDQGHIKGAVNIPQATIGTSLSQIPKQGNVIVYCDCPHDEESAGSAYTLRTAGYTNMKVLEGPQAYTLWKTAGYPVETSTP